MKGVKMRKKRTGVMYTAAALAAAAMISLAGCGGGGSVSATDTAAAETAAAVSSDSQIVYGTEAAARRAGAGSASDTLVVLPAGAAVPAGMAPVAGAAVQFTDSSGNVITLTTDANGAFNPNDLSDSTKSSDAANGKALLQAAQTDISQQPTIMVMPPATGKFKDNAPGNTDVSLAPKATGTIEVVSVKITPDVKKVLTGTKMQLNLLALDASGKVTRPQESVTWTASSGTCAAPSTSQTFTCIYTTPSAAGSVTLTATTKTTSGGTEISAKAVLEVIDAATLYRVSGKVYKSDGTTAWASAVVNFSIPPTNGAAPINITAFAGSGGNYAISLPPAATFTVSIGSPATADAKPVVYKATPSTFTSGAASASGTSNFTASAEGFKPPAPPPPIEKYVTGAMWDLRDAIEKSVMDTENGLTEIIFAETAASGTVRSGETYGGWTWSATATASAPVWTFVEPVPATGTAVPHRKLVISSAAAVTKIDPSAIATGTPVAMKATLKYVFYINKDGDVRTTNGLTMSTGEWTDDLTITKVASSGSGSDMDIAGTINATVKHFSPDKQAEPQGAATIKWTLASTGEVTIETTTKTGDGLKTLGSSKIVRSAQKANCDRGNPDCDMVTFTTPSSPFITHYAYTADGTQKAMTNTLTGSFKGDRSGSFTLTNTTTGDPQIGAKIIITIPAPPTTPQSTPPNRAVGYVIDKDGNTAARFTIDYKNQCTIVKFPGTSNETTSTFPL